MERDIGRDVHYWLLKEPVGSQESLKNKGSYILQTHVSQPVCMLVCVTKKLFWNSTDRYFMHRFWGLQHSACQTLRIDFRQQSLQIWKLVGIGISGRAGGRSDRIEQSPDWALKTCWGRMVASAKQDRIILLSGGPRKIPSLKSSVIFPYETEGVWK